MTSGEHDHPQDRSKQLRRVIGSLSMSAALLSTSNCGSYIDEVPDYNYTVVSTPDFMNADIGDVSQLPNWHYGDPNSDNAAYEQSIDTVLSAIANEGAKDVLVAGDTVQGHWGLDTEHTGIFGPTRNRWQRQMALRRAAKLYYTAWQKRFDDHGLLAYPALGDHEIGDNPWSGGTNRALYYRFKQQNVDLFKRQFGKYMLDNAKDNDRFSDHPFGPAANTAYAVRLNPEVELITLDVFEKTADDVAVQVDGDQLNWASQTMAQARNDGVDWLIVQYHTPVIEPVRRDHSSGLVYKGGVDSTLWKVMQHYHVNVVLNGEVHATTAHQQKPGDPVQITHGGALQYGLSTYLNMNFSHNKLNIKAVGFDSSYPAHPFKDKIWQTDTETDLPHAITYYNPHTIGTMTLTLDGVITERSGMLGVYENVT